MRAGISRVAVEVILLVLAVALALLIFSPVGSFIFSALGRTQLVGGTTTLEVMSVDVTNGYIYIKNQGPNTLTNADQASSWTVTFKTGAGEATISPDSVSSVGSADISDGFDPGESLYLDCSGNWPSSGASQTDTFTVIVYGPEGTRAEYIYRP